MNSQNKDNIQKAIALLKKNFERNNNSNSWADNIVNASKHLCGRVEWAHFYHFLANPRGYDMDKILLGKVDGPKEQVDLTQDSRLREIVYKNGTDATIHLKNDALYETEEDEKRQEWLFCIS